MSNDCLNPGDDALRDVYERSWRIMLRVFLDWNPAQIEDWIKTWRPLFRSNSLMDHEPASWYVAPLLIPHSLKERLGSQLNVASSKIVQAIDAGPLGSPDPVDDYDWRSARERVEHVLREISEGLDRNSEVGHGP